LALSCDISFAFLCGMVASTLGVGISTGLIILGVGLLTGFATLGVVASSLGTCLGGGVCACGAWLSSSSNFCGASYSIMPFVFLLPFRACVRLSMAFVSMSADVRVGCMMYLCLKNMVSDTLLLLVFFTWILWQRSCSGDVWMYHPSVVFSAYVPHLSLLLCNCTAHPIGANGILL
jgi:hypothetical protein